MARHPAPAGVHVTVEYEPDLHAAASTILAVLGDATDPDPFPIVATSTQKNHKTKRRPVRDILHESPAESPPPPASVPPETAPARRPAPVRPPHPYWNRRPGDSPVRR